MELEEIIADEIVKSCFHMTGRGESAREKIYKIQIKETLCFDERVMNHINGDDKKRKDFWQKVFVKTKVY